MVIIAYTGARRLCQCIETMYIYVGHEQKPLFTKGEIYNCVITDDNQLYRYYKIYGEEFDLSCTEREFSMNFVILSEKIGKQINVKEDSE